MKDVVAVDPSAARRYTTARERKDSQTPPQAPVPQPVSSTPLSRMERVIGNARNVALRAGSELGSANPERAAKGAVNLINANLEAAKKLGVDAATKTFWTRVLGVAVAAAALTAVTAAAVATGGAALAAAAAVAGIVLAISIADARYSYMHYENQRELAAGKPPPHDLPMGESSVGNFLFKVFAHGSTDVEVLHRAKIAAKGCEILVRGSLSVAGALCTLGATVVSDVVAQVTPLVATSVSLVHAAARFLHDRRQSKEFDAAVKVIDEQFQNVFSALNSARVRLVDNGDRAGLELLDHAQQEVKDLRLEVLVEMHKIRGTVPRAGVSALGGVGTGMNLALIVLGGYVPDVGSTVGDIFRSRGVPFYVTRAGGTGLDGLKGLIKHSIETAEQRKSIGQPVDLNYVKNEAVRQLSDSTKVLVEDGRPLSSKRVESPSATAWRGPTWKTAGTMLARGELEPGQVAAFLDNISPKDDKFADEIRAGWDILADILHKAPGGSEHVSEKVAKMLAGLSLDSLRLLAAGPGSGVEANQAVNLALLDRVQRSEMSREEYGALVRSAAAGQPSVDQG